MEGKHNPRFGPFALDAERDDLSKNGVALKTQPVKLLASPPGELVTRDEIGRLRWSDTEVVYDQSLNVAARQVMIALRDRTKSPAYIESGPRRGYRFIAAEASVNRRLLPAILPWIGTRKGLNRIGYCGCYAYLCDSLKSGDP